ncbi:MAG: hypothetical protein KJ919_01165, partial [Verrucomicrobia bacterium]|nr:hypothetical protein [Verrucomicrobiota bacterium]
MRKILDTTTTKGKEGRIVSPPNIPLRTDLSAIALASAEPGLAGMNIASRVDVDTFRGTRHGVPA